MLFWVCALARAAVRARTTAEGKRTMLQVAVRRMGGHEFFVRRIIVAGEE